MRMIVVFTTSPAPSAASSCSVVKPSSRAASAM
jgi:hypothetical protein